MAESTSIDEEADRTSREIIWIPFFEILKYSILSNQRTPLVQKKLPANWRRPPFGKFFNVGLNFENEAFFYIYKVQLGSWVDQWLAVSSQTMKRETQNNTVFPTKYQDQQISKTKTRTKYLTKYFFA